MILDFGYSSTLRDAGYSSGFLASSFFFAQVLTSYAWGWLSDRVGRRPIMLFGAVGSSVSVLAFGFSRSYPWALCARSLSGLLSNLGVSKSYLAEITDSSNAARAFGSTNVSSLLAESTTNLSGEYPLPAARASMKLMSVDTPL